MSVPGRLRLATFFLFLSVPLVSLETVLVTRAPYWDLPLEVIQFWALGVGLIVFPLIVWLNQGRRWALHLIGLFGVLWCLASCVLAVRLRSFWMAFFTVGLSFFWLSIYHWIRFEMNRSFFDPMMSWYQGLPRAIPRLSCELKVIAAKQESPDNQKKFDLKVTRLDQDGAFLFSERRNGLTHPLPIHKQKLEMTYRFDDRQVKCQGYPVRKLDMAGGIGVRFAFMNSDQTKDLWDFVERLRGEGYV